MTPLMIGYRTPLPEASRSGRTRTLSGPRSTPVKLIMKLLTDAEFLAAAADGILSPEEQQLIMIKRPPRSIAAARWSLADVILIDEVADLLQRTPSRGHVIIDEAQDLSPMMLRAVGRRASTGSVTVLGDLAQATTPWATRSWRESLTHLGHPNAAIEELVAGFRVPGAVIDFAARLLPHIAPTLKPPHSVRRHRGELDVRSIRRIGEELVEAITQTDAQRRHGGSDRRRRRRPRRPETAGAGTAGLRPARRGSANLRRPRRPPRAAVDVTQALKPILVPASLAKGLEFDHVVLVGAGRDRSGGT